MAARSALDVEIGLDVSGRALTLDPQPHPSDRLSHVSRHTIGMSSMPWREAPDSLAARAAISGTPLMRRRRLNTSKRFAAIRPPEVERLPR